MLMDHQTKQIEMAKKESIQPVFKCMIVVDWKNRSPNLFLLTRALKQVDLPVDEEVGPNGSAQPF